MRILTSALAIPVPTKPCEAAHNTCIEDPAKLPQGLGLLKLPRGLAWETPTPTDAKSEVK